MFKNYLPADIKAVDPHLPWWLLLALLYSNNATISLWPFVAAKNIKKLIYIQNTEQRVRSLENNCF